MEETEFKKLTANSRDWEIYKLLSKRSKETVVKDLVVEKDILNRLYDFHFEDLISRTTEPKGETTVEETITGKVVIISDKAVLIGNKDRVAWFPKSVIINLDKIALKQGEIVELKIVDWFKYKIEWKVPTQ